MYRSTPIQHTELPLGASVFRTPLNTLPDPPTRSNRLNFPKNRKSIVAGESSGHRRYFAHHDVLVDVNKTASRLLYQSISTKDTFYDCVECHDDCNVVSKRTAEKEHVV